MCPTLILLPPAAKSALSASASSSTTVLEQLGEPGWNVMFFVGTAGGVFTSLLSAVLLTAVIVFGVGVTFAVTKLLSKTLLKGIPSSFTLELPPYRKPQIGKVIVRSILDRTLFVLGRAISVAAPAGLVIWLMATGNGFFESNEDITSTALARKNSLWDGIQRIPLILEEIDKPVIAKVHGAAVGAGLDMALMCDIRIASESASLSESYFNAGIVPGDGGAYFLPRLVGRDKALDLFLTTRVLKGPEAERIGLVTHVVPDDQLDDYVERYVQKLLDAPQQAMPLPVPALEPI